MPALLKELTDGFGSIFGSGRGTGETAGQLTKRARRIESTDDLISRMWTADEELMQLGLESLYSRDFTEGEREELREALTRRLLSFKMSDSARELSMWTTAAKLGVAVGNIDQIALRENYWNWVHDSPRTVETALEVADAAWEMMMLDEIGHGVLRASEAYWMHELSDYSSICKKYGTKKALLGKKFLSGTMTMRGLQGPLQELLHAADASDYSFPQSHLCEALRLSYEGRSTWKAPAVFGG